jgi:hypothetical protein
MIYRGYTISFDPKPIPYRDFDFAHVDYDGPEDKRCGHGASVSDCQDQIDEIIYEAEG